MYAVFQAGGHQHRVEAGDVIDIQRLDASDGDRVEFGEVLFVGGDTGREGPVRVGQPYVDGAVVRGTVMGDEKGSKLMIFKYKPKNRYRVKTGHRQNYTRIKIDTIDL